jgi:hypothetical protein
MSLIILMICLMYGCKEQPTMDRQPTPENFFSILSEIRQSELLDSAVFHRMYAFSAYIGIDSAFACSSFAELSKKAEDHYDLMQNALTGELRSFQLDDTLKQDSIWFSFEFDITNNSKTFISEAKFSIDFICPNCDDKQNELVYRHNASMVKDIGPNETKSHPPLPVAPFNWILKSESTGIASYDKLKSASVNGLLVVLNIFSIKLEDESVFGNYWSDFNPSQPAVPEGVTMPTKEQLKIISN